MIILYMRTALEFGWVGYEVKVSLEVGKLIEVFIYSFFKRDRE
jgi:hypothetical protein